MLEINDNIQLAKARILKYAIKTPLIFNDEFNKKIGLNIFIKTENFQRTGSFKFRGALNKTLSLGNIPRSILVTQSSGNHGIAVSECARLFGHGATVILPFYALKSKIDAIRYRGAKILIAENTEEMNYCFEKEMKKTESIHIPSYDDDEIIYGQGTTIAESIDDFNRLKSHENLHAIVVPCGGGSLAAGAALAIERYSSATSLYGAEPENAADMKASLMNGQLTEFKPEEDTICDALKNRIPGKLTFELLKKSTSDIVLVPDEKVRDSIFLLHDIYKVVAEPSGAISMAAALLKKDIFLDKNILVVLSGGNGCIKSHSKIISATGFE